MIRLLTAVAIALASLSLLYALLPGEDAVRRVTEREASERTATAVAEAQMTAISEATHGAAEAAAAATATQLASERAAAKKAEAERAARERAAVAERTHRAKVAAERTLTAREALIAGARAEETAAAVAAVRATATEDARRAAFTPTPEPGFLERAWNRAKDSVLTPKPTAAGQRGKHSACAEYCRGASFSCYQKCVYGR